MIQTQGGVSGFALALPWAVELRPFGPGLEPNYTEGWTLSYPVPARGLGWKDRPISPDGVPGSAARRIL
jgi:hypothetical protein